MFFVDVVQYIYIGILVFFVYFLYIIGSVSMRVLLS